MATAAQVRAEQGSQVIIDLEPVWRGNQPYDLTGAALTAYVKPSESVPDDDPSTVVISEASSPAGVITVTDAANGVAAVTISGSVLAEPGTLSWRVDVTDTSGSVGTIAYGPVYVEPAG